MSEQPYYTPVELAKRWGVKPEKVRGWIKRGELKAIDLSDKPGIGRKVLRVTHDELLSFEQRRQSKADAKPKPKRKRLANVPSYF